MSKYGYGRETFVNPYHFVSLDGGYNRERNYKKIKQNGQTLTGWIECELETLTPIFIPNSSNDNAFKKFKELAGDEAKSYDFFSYEDIKNQDRIDKYSLPIIPGSEIKGMIRSAFEAVTNSCLSTIEEEKVLYKRVQHPAKPGRLVYEGKNWKIKECRRFRLPKTWVKIVNNKIYINGQEYKEDNKVYVKINYRNFKVEKISKAGFQKAKEGFLHIGEYNDNKNYESVFVLRKDKNGKEIEVALPRKNFKNTLINLIDNILLYRQKINKTEKHNRYRHFDETFGKIQDISHLQNLNVVEFNNKLREKYNSVFNYLNGALIYYTEHNGKYYLCPAAIGREVFYNKLQDVIKGYEPCNDIKNLCPACALFGMVKGKEAVASRVRFTDAFPVEKKQSFSHYYDNVVISPELASPKLSATEFYLKKPDDAHLWNYDYAGKWNERTDKTGNIKATFPFNTFKDYQPQIRGRKFYWHQKIEKAPGIELIEANSRKEEFSDRNVAIRPLKKGIKFSFRVYFNDITENELKKLMWVLEIGGSKDHAHKIGMGKPIGLGSVQITVKGAKIRKIMLKDNTIEYKFENKFENFEERLSVSEQNCQNTLGCSQKVFKEFMIITNFENAPQNISYPKNENQEENYHWFVANRQVGKATGTCPIIHQSLPSLDRPQLKKYIEK